MFGEIFSIIAPVFLCAAIGLVWVKVGKDYEVDFVTNLVSNVGAPCLVFTALVKADITLETMGSMSLASLAAIALFAVISSPILKLFRLEQRTFLPAMMFTNSGNMGLPLCLLAFGEPGLALAIAYFAVSLLLNFILGPAFASGSTNPSEAFKLPLVWAVLAALAVKFMGGAVPGWLFKTLELLGDFTIPLMLVTLGVSLADIHVKNLWRSLGLSVLRLTVGFFVGWGVAGAFGYEGVTRGVLIIECAMPVAVFNYLFAQLYNNRPEEVAGAVLVSTALSFLTLPALLWFVM